MSQSIVLPYIFDLELSGKCNTACTFCPRDEMKRGEQYMSEATFNSFFSRFKSYAKLVENQTVYLPEERVWTKIGRGDSSAIRVILCGMGESLMNPRCPDWIKQIRQEIGVRVSVVTNGLLLKPSIVEKLAESGVTVILVSVPGIDKQSYDRYMKIDWNRVLTNIQNSSKVLPGRVQINATIPDDADFSEADVIQFWNDQNVPIAGISHCHNRGGFLKDSSLTGRFGGSNNAFCGIIARHNFIAWDGRILSCCHDLHAENVLGSVENDEFLEIAKRKTPVVAKGAYYRICKNCNDVERCNSGQILTSQQEQLNKAF